MSEMTEPRDLELVSQIAAIKERLTQIQQDVANLVSTTDPLNMTEANANEFRRISEEVLVLRAKLGQVMSVVES